jgi:hypothetical protein
VQKLKAEQRCLDLFRKLEDIGIADEVIAYEEFLLKRYHTATEGKVLHMLKPEIDEGSR